MIDLAWEGHMTFKEFLKEAQWDTTDPSVGTKNNYSGDNHSGWLTGPSHSRDSDNLSRSNFDTALEMLGGEQDDVIEVEHCGHWACGWFERILVKADSPKAKILFKIHQSLQDYPLLDESDYSERELESQNDTFRSEQNEFCKTICFVLGLDFDTYKDSQDLVSVASALYSDACGYYGYEEAWVYEDKMNDYADSWNLGDMAKNRNPFAILLHRILFSAA
jgi:hypothetical protein